MIEIIIMLKYLNVVIEGVVRNWATEVNRIKSCFTEGQQFIQWWNHWYMIYMIYPQFQLWKFPPQHWSCSSILRWCGLWSAGRRWWTCGRLPRNVYTLKTKVNFMFPTQRTGNLIGLLPALHETWTRSGNRTGTWNRTWAWKRICWRIFNSCCNLVHQDQDYKGGASSHKDWSCHDRVSWPLLLWDCCHNLPIRRYNLLDDTDNDDNWSNTGLKAWVSDHV